MRISWPIAVQKLSWTYIDLVFRPAENTYELICWCNDNCEDDYSSGYTSNIWIFENRMDAVAFRLRWQGN